MLTRYFNRIEHIDHLIRIKGTGTPKQLAKRIHISERLLHSYISFMRKNDAPIAYNRSRCSYYYTEEVILNPLFTKVRDIGKRNE